MARTQLRRYAIEGTPPAIVCHDWPSIYLHAERGLTVDDAGLEDYPRQSIFLDGVFTGPAFLDKPKAWLDGGASGYFVRTLVDVVRGLTP